MMLSRVCGLNLLNPIALNPNDCLAQSHRRTFRRAMEAELKEEWQESEERLTEWPRSRLQARLKGLGFRSSSIA